MKMLSETTYGSTPAAVYLARTLNTLGNKTLMRNVGKRIVSSNKAVADLVRSYELCFLTAKTLANCLRLMREEISIAEIPEDKSPEKLVEQLTRNIQIGVIKQGIRLSTLARKAERVMESPISRCNFSKCTAENVIEFWFKDSNSNKIYPAGSAFIEKDKHGTIIGNNNYPSVFQIKDVNDITPELLMRRSNKRCARLNKPHMTT